MKNRIIKYLITVVITITVLQVKGQVNTVLHGLRLVPQSSYENPSFFPDETQFEMGIPIISGISANLYNTAFSFNDIFKSSDEYDSLYLNLQPIINDNNKLNKISGQIEDDLWLMGFKSGNTFISFGIKQRLFSSLVLSNDMLQLLWNGNSIERGNKFDLNNSFVNETHLMDYHVGVAIKTGNVINIGFRIHLLQGLSNISFEKNNISLTTTTGANSVYYLQANTDFLIHTSGISALTNSDSAQWSLSSYYFNYKNAGFSLDVGIDAKLSDNFRLTAAVLDLGSIAWRSNTKSYSSTVDSINFNGLEVDILKDTGIINRFSDTLKNLLKINTDTGMYSTTLRPQLLLGMEYYGINMRDRFSILFSGKFSNTGFEPAFSFGYDRKISNHFSYKINYTYLKYAPMNFGAGMVIDFKPFQFYIMSNNVFGFLLPKRQHYFQLNFGINIKIPGMHWSPPSNYEPHVFKEQKHAIPTIVDFKP